MKDQHFFSIVFLRCVATMIVFFTHVWIFALMLVDSLSDVGGAVFLLKTPAWAGVWIFFLLSGYLAGTGFAEGRYACSLKGTLKFYLIKYLRVALPAILFYLFVKLLMNPVYYLGSIDALARRFLLLFYDYPAGTGAIWFVPVIMTLYLLTPIVSGFCKWIYGRWPIRAPAVFCALIVFSLCAGLSVRLYRNANAFEWDSMIYKPFYMNLDLFLTGIFCAFLLKSTMGRFSIHKVRIAKMISWPALLALIVVNSYMYYWGDVSRLDYLFCYRIIFPTVYALVAGMVIFSSEYYMRLSQPVVQKWPTRIVNWFAEISFQFYLWHSVVLTCIYQHIVILEPVATDIELAAITFIISTLIAFVFTRGVSALLTQTVQRIQKL